MCDPSLRPNSSSSSYLPLPLQWWWWWWWWRLRSRKRRRSLYGFFYSFLSEINAGENQKTQWDKEAVVITISYSAVCRVSALYGIRWEKKSVHADGLRASATAGSIKSKPNNRQHQEEEPRPIDINGPNGGRHGPFDQLWGLEKVKQNNNKKTDI